MRSKNSTKLVRMCLAALFCTVLLQPLMQAPAQAAVRWGVVSADQVNLRSGPSTKYKILDKIDSSTSVQIQSEKNGWYYIEVNGLKGYMSKNYIFNSSSNPATGVVTGNGVRFRADATTGAKILATLKANDKVTVTGYTRGWYYAVYNGKKGYVSDRYVRLGSQVQTTAAATATAKATATATATTAYQTLKMGAEGANVSKLQTALKKRGYFNHSVTGLYGSITRDAVAAFQKDAKLRVDGIAGPQTLSAIYSSSNTTGKKEKSQATKVTMPDWSTASKVFARGTTATVTDARTGIRFQVRRFGGTLHADCEPLTKEDTAKMKKAYGGEWSWDRRPIWVTIGSQTFAASMNGMPHMANPTPSNDFPGHFCIHFKGSKVHETGEECPRHQAAVLEAYNLAKKL
ncbi:MAG: SH3 domain-containing protein [Bacillota bacterium]